MNTKPHKITSTSSSKALEDVTRQIKQVLVILVLLFIYQNTAIAGIYNRSLDAPEWSKYDHFFRKYTKEFFGKAVDWRLFKTQAIIESNLKYDAKSSRGAIGVMQIVPTTYKEIQTKNKRFKSKSLHSPEWNIAAGICYNKYLFKRWNTDITNEKRITLMLASYNAGYSRVKKAFKKAGKPENSWSSVAKHVPRETRNYIKKINKLFRDTETQASVTRHPSQVKRS